MRRTIPNHFFDSHYAAGIYVMLISLGSAKYLQFIYLQLYENVSNSSGELSNCCYKNEVHGMHVCCSDRPFAEDPTGSSYSICNASHATPSPHKRRTVLPSLRLPHVPNPISPSATHLSLHCGKIIPPSGFRTPRLYPEFRAQ